MAFLAFSDLGYEYLDQGYFVLFSENNTHDLLFEYVTKDLTGLAKLLTDYVGTRLDEDFTIIRDGEGNEIMEQIIDDLKSVHKYYEFEYRKTIINGLGRYFNKLLIYLCCKLRTLNSDIPKREEWYLERIIWLLKPLLKEGDRYHVDFYNEFKEQLGEELYTSAGSTEGWESFVENVSQGRPEVFGEEIRTQQTIRDMLFFILDIGAPNMDSLKKSQRMWLYANMVPKSFSGISVKGQLSFRPNPRFHAGDDRTQEIENSTKIEDAFATLKSLDSQTITRMDEETKCCFQRAIEMAKGIQEMPLYEEYAIDTLRQLLYLEIISMIQKDTIIRKCRNCNRYFVAKNQKVAYCDRMDNSGKRCSSVGSQRSFQKKMAEDEELKIYTRAYKTHFARVRKGIMNDDDLTAWREEAKAKLERVRAGTLEIDTFQKWLKK